jgi:hypothetical protein
MLRVALCVSFVSAVTLAKAAELETTHLFGFTFGSDVNAVGEREAESEAVGRFGKSAGRYGALSQGLGVKFVPFQNLSVQPTVAISRFDISNVPGLEDKRQLSYEAASVELRYRLIDREKAQFGLTMGFDPRWARVDEISGAAFLLIVDKELVDKFIFAAFNFIYEPERTHSRVTSDWEQTSELGLSIALAAQIRPSVLVGAEMRYMRSFDGLGLDRFTGNALFVGPTLYAKFSEKAWMSAAWSAQVAGRAHNGMGALDTINFEQHRVLLRFGYNF